MLTLILSQIFLYFISNRITAQPNFISHVCQDTFGNYTPNSAFQRNLNTFFSTISSDTSIDYGFYNFSIGQNLDIVNGIGLCRPDISPAACRSCLNEGARAIVLDCPTKKDAIGWYEKCMLRYSDRYIFGKKEFGPWYPLDSLVLSRINKKRFNHTASELLVKLQAKAASGDSRRKFAAGQANVTSNFSIYALVQCTPDLGSFDCSDCLGNAIDTALSQYYGEQARVFFTSCNIRYENYLFYDPTGFMSFNSSPSLPPPSPASLLPSSKGKGRATKKFWIIIVGLLVVVILLAILVFWLSRRKKPKIKLEDDNNIQITCVDSLPFDFSTIQAATNNFSDANKLGKGSSTTFYKGILPGEQLIAVKRFSSDDWFGELEYNNEVLLLADLQHRNLVKLLGFCVEEDSRFLIYEYLLNGSLDLFLEDPVKRANLSWETRHKIIVGIARGLLYLHEDSLLRVIHRDLKPSNILLDVDMNPKITDFSRASLVQVDQTRRDSSIVLGTYGYMPPEYVEQGHFSVKSDVFSFGILLLEIITGQLIDNFCSEEKGESLPSFVWRKWSDGKPSEAIDQALTGAHKHTTQMLGCIKMALLCVQENSTSRPTMSTVVFMLNSNLITNVNPSRPAYIIYSDTDCKKDKVNETSANGASISQLDPH